MEANRTITDGPSKDRLFDACKYACGETTIKCDFSVLVPGSCIDVKYPAIILAIKHEDGSGESFIIEGIFTTHRGHEHFKAYYSSKRRKGVVTEIIA